MKEVAIQISQARVNQNLTPCELANKADVQLKIVHDLEEGSEKVNVSALVKVAHALGLQTHISFKNKEDVCNDDSK